MSSAKQKSKSSTAESAFAFSVVVLAALVLLGLTVAIAWLAQSFPYLKEPGRPIVKVVFAFWIASAVSLTALFCGLRIRQRKKSLVGLVIVMAIALRVVLIFSNPILEVDFYRYLWDGVAANNGVSPFKFSPEAVLKGTSTDTQLQTLQDVIAQNPTAHTLVSRVHFEKFTTLYPPVSQFVFRMTTAITPDSASVETHIVMIKLILVLFDLGVVGCIFWMIVILEKHPAWLIAYAWNPLVLKEIGNSGHLDSIAIFFMTAGVACFVWAGKQFVQKANDPSAKPFSSSALGASIASGGLMALGIGAKLFPIVVVPAMCFWLWTKCEKRAAIFFAATCILVTSLVLAPMFNPQNRTADVEIADPGNTPLVNAEAGNDGLTAFVTQWRMNDVIFSFVYQNIEYDWRPYGTAWYVFVPNDTRIQWCQSLANTKLANGNGPYFIARLATVGMFALFYIWMLFRIRRSDSAEDMAGLLFLIMGVFFYLQPTQNPWYWVWAMPLVCFAKNRGWLFVSLILFVYYLRFWFTEMKETYQFFGAPYVGVDYFDHCVVWFEFITVITILIVSPLIKKRGFGAPIEENQ